MYNTQSPIFSQGRRVYVTPEGIAMFNSHWHCSNLTTDRKYWFEFYWFEFSDDGSLINTNADLEKEGLEVLALSKDCMQYLVAGIAPSWAM